MRRHVQFFVGICRADFHQTLIRVLFFSRLESKPTEQRKFNLIPIDQFFVADPENLTAGCIYLSRGRCQIFMVRDKKLIDWHQIEFSLLSRVAFEARRKQHTSQSLMKIGSTNPHKNLHVPAFIYCAVAAKFSRFATKNRSIRTKLNFHFALSCCFRKKVEHNT